MQYSKKRSSERGLALLVVLWIVVAAALLVSAFNATVRSGVSLAGSEVQLAQTEALLDAGVEIAAGRLIDEEKGRRWLPDGTQKIVPFAGTELVITVSDANGRIDLNKTDTELLLRFLRQVTGSDSTAGRLRDRIMQARGEVGGKKGKKSKQTEMSADGEEETEKQTPEAVPFVDIAQLRSLPGMTPELYAQLAPLITVYSRDGRISPLAAPDEVLRAIPNLTRSDIERLRSALASEDEENEAVADIRRRVGAYLAEKPGPAYVVSVQVVRRGVKHIPQRVYVIAVGLDSKAPYRLIAKRPMTFAQRVRTTSG